MINKAIELISFYGKIDKTYYKSKIILMLGINFFFGIFMKLLHSSPQVTIFNLIVPIIFIFSLVSIFSLVVRRLRDINKSIWWVIPGFAFTVLIYILAIYLCFKDSK